MKQRGYGLLTVMIVLALVGLISGCQEAPAYQVMSASGTGFAIEGANTDQFVVDQTSTGDIVEFRNNGTVRWRLAYDGAITQSGDETHTGDVTVEGAVIVDGQADAVQLTAQGYTTQTSNIFVVETSGGTDLFWVDNNGDAELNGTTPVLTIGDAGEEDTAVVFDGAAQDYHIGLYDTDDDLVIGLGSALGTTGIIYLDENQEMGIGGASAGAKLDVTGNVMIDGGADEQQLVVQGHSTQSSNAELFVVENSSASDLFWVTATGDAELNGTTPMLTLGDSDDEDTGIVFDGGQQDFYAAVYDTNDDLVIGLGSAVGTTGIIYLDENQEMGIGGASAGAKLDVTGNVMIDGGADEEQLVVQGHSSQTNSAFVIEQSDGTDKFTVSDAGNTVIVGTLDAQGNLSDSGGTFTVADNVMVDGAADAEQLVVQGNGTQTSNTFVVETSAGSDLFWVDNNGDAELNGTTPVLTIGDAGEEDTAVVFDGAAQDYHIGLYDTGDDLVIGLGSALGTTGIIYLDENQEMGIGGASAGAKLDVTGNVEIDGGADEVQLTVQGHTTQTSNLLTLEQSDGSDKLTVDDDGHVTITAEPDDDADNYDRWVTIQGYMTGKTTKDRNYGLYVSMQRPAGQELDVGDHDEAGIQVRVDTHAVTTTAGTVLRGVDAEAKADNPDGTVTNLFGGSFTAKSDSGAGDVGTMVALQSNTQNNAAVDDFLASADFRLMRQAATEPTAEYVVQIRNSSTSGSGADAGIYVTSDYSDTLATDDMDYGIDFDTADVGTAEVRGSNGETLSNVTDTAWQVGGFTAFEEASVIDLGADGTITPTASYQPVTNSTEGSINTSATTAIADGAVAGAILIICNEDAQDIVVKDGANIKIGGDVTLTGGADDCLTVIWNGADWVGLAMHDN